MQTRPIASTAPWFRLDVTEADWAAEPPHVLARMFEQLMIIRRFEEKVLEQLAEDGNAEPLIASLKATPGVRMAGLFVPGQPFEIVAAPGDRLVFASMFVQSNDLFFAPRDGSIALFDRNGGVVEGDLTDVTALWDAGTEVNQQPGTGSEQAPRQGMAGVGTAENGVVHMVADGFAYPRVEDVVRVTIAPK